MKDAVTATYQTMPAADRAMPIRNVAFFFLLMYVLTSFADLRFSVGGKGFFTFSNFEFSGYILLLALLACLFVGDSTDSTPLPVNAPQKWLALYFTWGVAAAVLARGEVGKTILIELKEIVPAIIGYLSVILLLSDGRKTKAVLVAWTGAGFVNVLLGASQFFFGGPHPAQLGDNAMQKLDIGGEVASSLVSGWFTHPNLFSQVVIPYVVVFATAWLISDSRFSFRALCLLALAVLFGLLLTVTMAKGAILWALLGVVLAAAMSRWRRLRCTAFFVSGWIVCVAGIYSLALLLFWNVLDYHALRTLFSRLEFMVASINIFTDHPLNALLGGGMRFWSEYSSWTSWDYPNAHNVYLNQMLFYGAIGLGSFACFILAHVRRALASFARTSDPLLSPLPYVAAVFAMTGSYCFEPSFADPIQKFQLLFMLAMAVTLSSPGFQQMQVKHG